MYLFTYYFILMIILFRKYKKYILIFIRNKSRLLFTKHDSFIFVIEMKLHNKIIIFVDVICIYRMLHHIIKRLSRSRLYFLLNIPLNPRRFLSKQRFITLMSMKKVKCACQLLVQRIGNLQRKQIRVLLFSIYYFWFEKNGYCQSLLNSVVHFAHLFFFTSHLLYTNTPTYLIYIMQMPSIRIGWKLDGSFF